MRVVIMQFNYSLSVHPNGLYILAAFYTNIKLMAILIDDITPFWETNSIASCTMCKFSNGGHLFAAIWNSNIMVCNTWSYEIVASMKLQSIKLNSIHWSEDDLRLVSFSTSGVVKSLWIIIVDYYLEYS